MKFQNMAFTTLSNQKMAQLYLIELKKINQQNNQGSRFHRKANLHFESVNTSLIPFRQKAPKI
jgi:hypothetical protein